MRLACFFHVRISGGAHPANEVFEANPALNEAHARSVLQTQATAMFDSGLMDALSHFVIGVNGGVEDFRTVRQMFGPVNIISHGPESSSELPTLLLLERWSRMHPGWAVLYFHTKSVSWPPGRPGWQNKAAWLRCLMKHTVENWEICVNDLMHTGADMVGPHWMSPHAYPKFAHALPRHGIFGGNFWWTKTDYLATLPDLMSLEPGMKESYRWRMNAEMLVGSGAVPPRVVCYTTHHPNGDECPH